MKDAKVGILYLEIYIYIYILGLGILLFIVIMLQAAFEAFQDWSSSKVMNSIKGMMAADATVIRNGVEMKISAEKIVVGDLVVLTYGTKVPADLRLIECADLRFDRSMLTGESEAIEGIFENLSKFKVLLRLISVNNPNLISKGVLHLRMRIILNQRILVSWLL